MLRGPSAFGLAFGSVRAIVYPRAEQRIFRLALSDDEDDVVGLSAERSAGDEDLFLSDPFGSAEALP